MAVVFEECWGQERMGGELGALLGLYFEFFAVLAHGI